MRRFPVMLFAAGFGTRMGALIQATPKPLIPVGGRTLLDHALHLCNTNLVSHKVINLQYFGDKIASHLEGHDIALSPENPILETGGGLRAALPLLGNGPVLTLNTDAVWYYPQPKAEAAMVRDRIAFWKGVKVEA